MRNYRLTLILITISTIICLNADAEASVKNRVFSLQLDLYGIQPALNDSAQVWLFSPYYGADFQYMISQQTGLMFSARTGKVYNDSVSTSIFKFNNDRANRRWTLTSISAGPKFYLNQRKGTTPFFVTRVELMIWKVETHPGGERIAVADGADNPKDFQATELGITGGFGIEQLIADRFAFTISAEFTYLTGVGADFAQWVKNSRSRAILQFGAGVSIHFGGKRKSLSDRGDDSEYERMTRKVYEAEVDEEGDTIFVDQAKRETVRDSIVAAPMPVEEPERDSDGDGDGISDKVDRCIGTPSGAVVDRDGCPVDSDKDGIADGIDRCPNTTTVEVPYVDGSGCTPDSDYDGIPDYRDLCPNSLEQAVVDSNGCVMDFDKDGVENSRDLCPDTPANLPVDDRGCPDLKAIFPKQVFHDLFNSGGTKVKGEQTAPLDSLARLMKAFGDVSATVYGYTDDVGPNDANLQLSQKRADAVRTYLIAAGIDKGRVLSIGRGEINFMASNRTRNGREINRRIEIEFKVK
ncbi:MAG: OmpA family protein [Candidatus Zixiibacteriota bacterium]